MVASFQQIPRQSPPKHVPSLPSLPQQLLHPCHPKYGFQRGSNFLGGNARECLWIRPAPSNTRLPSPPCFLSSSFCRFPLQWEGRHLHKKWCCEDIKRKRRSRTQNACLISLFNKMNMTLLSTELSQKVPQTDHSPSETLTYLFVRMTSVRALVFKFDGTPGPPICFEERASGWKHGMPHNQTPPPHSRPLQQGCTSQCRENKWLLRSTAQDVCLQTLSNKTDMTCREQMYAQSPSKSDEALQDTFPLHGFLEHSALGPTFEVRWNPWTCTLNLKKFDRT